MIRTHTEGELRVVTFDRPERRNALTRDALDALRDTFEAADEPVVYLTGAGEAFCAGADLDAIATLETDEGVAFARLGQDTARAIAEYDGAVVAGVDGPARGGGVELALACDVRVCTPDATFAENGVSLGLFGAWGGTARLPRIVGQGAALDIALSGRVLDAEQARRMGLVSRIVEDPARVAAQLLDNDAAAMRTVKRRIRDDAPPEEQEQREAEALAELIERLQRSDA